MNGEDCGERVPAYTRNSPENNRDDRDDGKGAKDKHGKGVKDKPGKLWEDQFEKDCGIEGLESCLGQFIKYYSFTFGTAIPNPITLTLVGWHMTVTLDQYNSWYVGLGMDLGKSYFGANGSFVGGTFTKNQLPESEIDQKVFVEDFLTAHTVQGYFVPIAYLGGNYSISTQTTSFETGIGSPQVGGAWTYTWNVSK
jgi:hypothetical protein